MNTRETQVHATDVPWRRLAGLLLVSLVLGALPLFTRSSRYTFVDALIDVLSALYVLLLALWCFQGSRWLLGTSRSPVTGKRIDRRFIPVLLGMGTLCLAFGLLVWTYESIRTQQAPTFPSLTHLIYSGAYPFFLAAFLLLPLQNLSRLSRLRILFDSLIILTAVTTLYSYYLLVPILAKPTGTLLEKSVGSLFTAADLVLLFCLLLVALRSGEVVLRQVIVLLGLAVSILFVGHVVYLWLLLSTVSRLIIRPTPVLFVSLTLMAVAAQTMRQVLGEGEAVEQDSPVLLEETGLSARWRTLLGSALVLIFALLVLSLWMEGEARHYSAKWAVVDIGGTFILILLVVRQLLAMHEVNSLKRDLRVKNAQLARLAASDPLTGVPNHQTLVDTLDEALARAKAQQGACSILFVDIDHFKALNDQYGHQVGDRVLCQFARLATSLLGPEDSFGRWGGEEFVAVLPGKEQDEAGKVAEQMQQQVAEQVFAGEVGLQVTCSLGVATYPSIAKEAERLITCADQAMYLAKHLGRNQVHIAHELEGSGL